MKYKFSEIVDLEFLQNLMEGLYSASGILSAIVDIDGSILASAGWRDICTKFHRVNSETNLLCRQSDQYLKQHIIELGKIEPYISYQCLNGLNDAAAPIIIDGEHLATIYHGQFLTEEPDIEKFRIQAQKYGFDKEEYLKELENVPIYTKEKLDSIMNYFIQLAEMLGKMGVNNLRLIESQKKVLHESEANLKAIANNTHNIAFQSYDAHGKILFANNASESIFGWVNEDIAGKSLTQFQDNKVMNKILDLLDVIVKTGKPYAESEWTFTNIQGVEKHIFTTFFTTFLFRDKLEFICMSLDVTEKKHFEKEMYRLDQLQTIGKMAAGIAHEVRNPMTVVRGYLQLLQNKKELHEFESQFELMIDEIDRANSIITEFLSLSKTQPAETEMFNLNDIIAKIFPLIQADTYSKNMQITFEPGEISLVHVNSKEIVQLILNLCRNGLEAMREGGCLKLKTFEDGQNVVLSVGDDGSGITDENLSMLGKPFFSTKDYGTGLGLASCYNIATRHNAKIEIDTSPHGTTFYIRFASGKKYIADAKNFNK